MSRGIDILRGTSLEKSDLVDIVALNRTVYGEHLAAPLDLVESIYNKNADICLVAKDPTLNKFIGYISAIPLSSEAFNKITDPAFAETIGANDVVEYDYCRIRNGIYHLYIASIVVDPSYRQRGVSQKLYFSLIDFLLMLGEEYNILFEDIAARATPQGESICMAIGMNHIGTADGGEKIFYLRMLPPSLKDRSEKGMELVRLYEDRYRRLKRNEEV